MRSNQYTMSCALLDSKKKPMQLTHRFTWETQIGAIEGLCCASLCFKCKLLRRSKRHLGVQCKQRSLGIRSKPLAVGHLNRCSLQFRDLEISGCVHLRGTRNVDDCQPMSLKIVSSLSRDCNGFWSWSRVPPTATDSDCVTNNQ